YKDRAKLPPNETNGNTPLVSAYEVAWYSWKVTGDARIADLVEQDEIKDTIDLCYQTLALAGIDRTKHKEKIQRNAGRILSLQRPSGQWSMRFDSAQAEVEFQTGHALWALHAAGIPADHPQVAKAIQYLLGRQQQFGGWMDPLQSFENFRTPFRETQMAVLALSSYFPGPDVKKGWDAPKTAAGTLLQLDAMWDAPSPAAIDRAIHAARSPEVLVRQQAIEALGRSAPGKFARLFEQALSDPSKLVQRTAAWSLRQSVVQAASPAQPDNILLSSLRSPGDRTRWAATRVFATHFSALAHRPGFAQALATLVDDPIPTVRMQALKGLWQFWFWTPADASKNLIEDTFLAAIAKPQHPWVDRNLREGIYNLADDNIRYLYNNWIPLLADPADRERAIRGRLDIEARLADKFSGVLERGAGLERKRLLSGLTEFHLRRGDVYDVKADHTRPAPPVYNRIGNDIEQSAFFGPANDRFARAVLPLLASSDPEMRRLALNAAVLARPVRFPGVNEAAGDPGQGRALLTAALQQTRPEPAEVLRAFGQAPRGAAGPQAAPRRQPTRYGRPDESYFRGRVEPILERRGKDGFACIHCHASHTIFNGQYGTVMNVVDLNDPENSLLLRKPISSAETEGTLGSATLPHGGGVRWEKGSPEYQTILDWIKGAK
ncbi:MAG: HEAT repeat domain-containing protein, partial [Bryobacteraceae bacterium]